MEPFNQILIAAAGDRIWTLNIRGSKYKTVICEPLSSNENMFRPRAMSQIVSFRDLVC